MNWKNIRIKKIENWEAAFGQTSAAQYHLRNKGIEVGDIFLFFGYFQKIIKLSEDGFIFDKNAPVIHAVYGYLQIGEIITGDKIKKYFWHPHSLEGYKDDFNTLYIASSDLKINNEIQNKPGHGVFKFSEDLVLTKEGMSRSKWKIYDWMKTTEISFHSKESIKENYFQSAKRGQEFVIQEDVNAINWLKALLK